MRRLAIGLLLLASLLAIVGIALGLIFHGPPSDSLSAVVPAEARQYVHFYLDPSTGQGRSFRSFLDSLDASDASAVVDEPLASCGLMTADLESGGATQVGIFVMPDGTSACVTDAELKQSGAAEISGRWLTGDAGAIEAARAKGMVSLTEDANFVSQVAEVPGDRIALFFKAGSQPKRSTFTGLAARLHRHVLPSGAIALTSESGRLVFEGHVSSDGAMLWPEDPVFELSSAPGSAWFAATVPRFSEWVDELMRRAIGMGWPAGTPPGAADLERLSDLVPKDAVVWVGGGPTSPFAGIRSRAGTTALAGISPDERMLETDDRAGEAFGWVGEMVPMAYLDAVDARPWLAVGSAISGIDIPTDRLDRIVVGVLERTGGFDWRLVVSAAEPKG